VRREGSTYAPLVRTRERQAIGAAETSRDGGAIRRSLAEGANNTRDAVVLSLGF
jgi:hypothetical protein